MGLAGLSEITLMSEIRRLYPIAYLNKILARFAP